MPQKQAVATFDAIMRELKSGEFSPIYLLMGEESYYIDQICDYIQTHALTPEQQAFDQTVVFGADVNAVPNDVASKGDYRKGSAGITLV